MTFTIILSVMLAFSLMRGAAYSYASWTEGISLLLVWIPPILSWTGTIDLPWPISLGAGVALSLHSYGILSDLYDSTLWFSHFAHFVSGIVVAMLVATILMIVVQQANHLKIPIRWIPFFVFIGVLSLEGFWKIFEYTMDHILGTMMDHGLEDMMNDNLSDTIAGIVAGLGTAYYMSRTSLDEFVNALKADRVLNRFKRIFRKGSTEQKEFGGEGPTRSEDGSPK